MKIIVTGSLGNISKPLTQELLQKGHEVVVISGKAEKQQEIEALGARAAIGALEDADFLITTFIGADAVYAMVPPNFAVPDQLAYYELIGNNYARAIEAAGIKRVVLLSSWGAHLPKGTGFIVGSHRVELIFNTLKGTGVTYLRPCSFYNNLYHYVEMIKNAGFIGTNYGDDDRVVMVSPKDIANIAAEELELQSQTCSIRYIASSEHSCREIALVLGTAIGKPDLKWVTLSDEQVQQAMEQNGLPPAIAAKMVELNASIHSGLIREDYDLHPPIKMGKVSLEDFAQEFAAAFQ